MRLWGGRFSSKTDELMRAFNDSFAFDRRLYAADIRGSMAYARALVGAGLLTENERDEIIKGLEQVLSEFNTGRFEHAPGDEDIHTAVERRLTELVGPVAGKLHTGRSRNDQVATDLRLWLLDASAAVDTDLRALGAALLTQAEAYPKLIMPGYTHLQPAQPVLFAHWLLSYFWMIDRDRERLAQSASRTAVLPLGAGALAGNPFSVDREAMASELAMLGVSANSMDAVSDRDFVAEFLFVAALLGAHLSRMAEDLILYSSPGFAFVQIGEAYTTGSSLMPQKRNPDSLELTRGKSARLLGNLVSLLAALKGLPSTYNKDLQEDKEPLFDTVDTLEILLPVVTGVIKSLEPDPTAMRRALDPGMLATDLAGYLVRRGMPFREAHHVVGRVVRRAEERGAALDQLSLAELQAESDLFAEDVMGVFDFAASVARRSVAGGTAPQAVSAQMAAAWARLDQTG